MEPILAGLARFVASVPHDAIPGAVRDHAALVVADTVGAILGGSQEPEIRRLHAGADRAAGPATLLGAGFVRVEPWWAIVANGLAGTMLELDRGNRFARGHPGIHALPAALAEAERLGRSGGALLAALVVGYDVAARLGGGAPVRPGMHMHGVHGAVGAAAAVARQVDQPFGEFDRPYPEPALREKFVALAGPDLGAAGAGSAWELCRHAGELKNARELTDGLRTLALSRHPH